MDKEVENLKLKVDAFCAEEELSPIVTKWLESRGYTVYAELAHKHRNIDLVGVREAEGDRPLSIVAVELKLSLNEKLIAQTRVLRQSTWEVFAAFPTNPRRRALERLKDMGIGVLFINRDGVTVLAEPRQVIAVKLGWYYRINVRHRQPGGTGGIRNKAGEGVAQQVWARIKEYLREKPTADWNEIWTNVPSHYRTANGMRLSMELLSKRENQRTRAEKYKERFAKKLVVKEKTAEVAEAKTAEVVKVKKARVYKTQWFKRWSKKKR